MNLNFDIPTPKSCRECKFHYVDRNPKDFTYVLHCRVSPDVNETMQDATTGRSKNCIGTVDDDE